MSDPTLPAAPGDRAYAPAGWLRLLPGAFLVAGLATTGLVWWNARSDGGAALHREFEAQATTVARELEGRLQDTSELLRGVVGLFAASPELDRRGFKSFAEAQNGALHAPGLQGIGFAVPLSSSDGAVPAEAGPPSAAPAVAVYPPGQRPAYAPITHLAPQGPASASLLGYDLLVEPALQESLTLAREQGRAVLSPPITLRFQAGGGDDMGFVLVAPAFRSAAEGDASGSRFVGWAFVRLAARPLLVDALTRAYGDAAPLLRMRVFDGRGADGEHLFFDSLDAAPGRTLTPLRSTRLVELAGQAWTVEFEALPGFAAGVQHGQGWRVLAGGILLSVVLAILARILVGNHRRVAAALAQTAQANQELHESRRRFRILANSVPVLIWVSDATGTRNWFGQQWVDFTGCDPNANGPYTWSDFIHPEDREAILARIAEASCSGEGFSLEYRLANIDGSFHWVMDSATPRFSDRGELAGYIGSCVDIHDRKLAEAGLHEREALLRSIYDASSAAIFLVDLAGRITHANHRMSELFGRPMDDLIGSDYISLIAPPERESASRRLSTLLGREMPSVNLERVYYRQDKSLFWGLLTGRPLRNGKGEVSGLVGVIADVTARKEAEAGMALAARVFEACHEGIFIADAQRRIISVNPAFSAISGYSAEESLGRDIGFLASKRHPEAFFEAMIQTLDTMDHWEGEVWNRHHEGAIYPAWLAITRIAGSDGQTSNFVAIFTDISERKKSEAKMHHLAHYDYLTDLPNRALLIERLALIHSTARRYGKGFAVLFADLDLFKRVNDDYGHNVGDALLIEVAHRLKAITRDSDTVSRQGGDEFVILVPELNEPVKLLELAEKLRNVISSPYEIQGHRLTVAVSLGIAIYPRDGETVDDIMRAADSAMYRAKNAGHNKIRFANGDQNGQPGVSEPEPIRPLYVVSRGRQ
ncbi:MAG: PAS domain S-box protein [Azonexus sp.]|nr:PAS domain S-box protein [Betaproteobacteria bacterium]MBK8919490.1 PAS domain S-box protein [Betaproteobacteria bacterium]MBP6036257.1 PAS domain S-box protein [Azonexus sp.]MBP6906879.1 PAS domain S-box protein [Azonexus sp.]